MEKGRRRRKEGDDKRQDMEKGQRWSRKGDGERN